MPAQNAYAMFGPERVVNWLWERCSVDARKRYASAMTSAVASTVVSVVMASFVRGATNRLSAEGARFVCAFSLLGGGCSRLPASVPTRYCCILSIFSSLWPAYSYASVPSVPALLSRTSMPPGWSEQKVVRSYTGEAGQFPICHLRG